LNRGTALEDGMVGPSRGPSRERPSLADAEAGVYGLKMEHKSLKTRQQRVMQLPGDARSFGQALFKSQGELGFRHLRIRAPSP